MISKHFFNYLILILLTMILWSGCEPGSETETYSEQLVIFGNLKANRPLIDTVYVSRSYAIKESHERVGKWINDATVTVSDGDTVIVLSADPPGRYVDLVAPNAAYTVIPNRTYKLEVTWGNQTVTAQTTVPDSLTLESIISNEWKCNGKVVPIPALDLHRFENTPEKIELALLTHNYSSLVMDTVVYREGECYTSSFASVPMFLIRWQTKSEPGLIRLVNRALEDDHQNAIVDTSFSANIFKGSMLVDEQGFLFRPNPLVSQLSQSVLPFGWMSFNYYGPHLVEIQVADQSYQDYYRGQPLGQPQNSYLLPQGNIAGGYGLFSSTNSSYFVVYIQKEE
ncbi:MAG: DUF4249 family protein [Fidelibacterota bacterium]